MWRSSRAPRSSSASSTTHSADPSGATASRRSGLPIADAAERARERIRHHGERLRRTAAALGPEPRTGYDVSLALFGLDLKPAARRFAVAESLSHLERLVAEGGAVKSGADGPISYTPA